MRSIDRKAFADLLREALIAEAEGLLEILQDKINELVLREASTNETIEEIILRHGDEFMDLDNPNVREHFKAPGVGGDHRDEDWDTLMHSRLWEKLVEIVMENPSL